MAEFLAEADFACGGGDGEDVLAGEDGAHGVEGVFIGLVREDACFLRGGEVAELALDVEAVHLCLREGIGAAEFDGVLGGDDEEEAVEVVAVSLHGDLAFAHGLEEGALGSGGGAVDFIGEEYVREDGAAVEVEFPGVRVEDGDAENVGGKEVRGELDALEGGAADGVGDGFGECRFPGAGVVLEERVAAGEHAGEHFAHGFALASDDFADGEFQFVGQFGFPHFYGVILGVAGVDSTFIFREMSIITQRGDEGMTDLMFGRRIAKTSRRFAALGTIDELNAAIGLARDSDGEGRHTAVLDRVQNSLFGLMGQLACLPEDKAKYAEGGYARVTEEDLEWLTRTAGEVEEAGVRLSHWAVPGAEGSVGRAHLDLARTVCRRAEREVLLLDGEGGEVPREVRMFLNRISDLMWILARSEG